MNFLRYQRKTIAEYQLANTTTGMTTRRRREGGEGGEEGGEGRGEGRGSIV